MIGGNAVRMTLGVIALSVVTACGLVDGFHLAVSNLQIGPTPAEPGDEVVATFFIDITPLERHTIILNINDTEHLRLTSSEEPTSPYVLSLGDAANLIGEYGTGTHSARIEVRAEEHDKSARTRSFSFELRSAPAAP